MASRGLCCSNIVIAQTLGYVLVERPVLTLGDGYPSKLWPLGLATCINLRIWFSDILESSCVSET